jgi:hypothetical protein
LATTRIGREVFEASVALFAVSECSLRLGALAVERLQVAERNL